MSNYSVQVGDDILYHPSHYDKHDQEKAMAAGDGPLGGHCAHVHSAEMINVSVFDANGRNHGRTSVPFWNGVGSCPFIGSESAWAEPNTRQNTAAAKAVSEDNSER